MVASSIMTRGIKARYFPFPIRYTHSVKFCTLCRYFFNKAFIECIVPFEAPIICGIKCAAIIEQRAAAGFIRVAKIRGCLPLAENLKRLTEGCKDD